MTIQWTRKYVNNYLMLSSFLTRNAQCYSNSANKGGLLKRMHSSRPARKYKPRLTAIYFFWVLHSIISPYRRVSDTIDTMKLVQSRLLSEAPRRCACGCGDAQQMAADPHGVVPGSGPSEGVGRGWSSRGRRLLALQSDPGRGSANNNKDKTTPERRTCGLRPHVAETGTTQYTLSSTVWCVNQIPAYLQPVSLPKKKGFTNVGNFCYLLVNYPTT